MSKFFIHIFLLLAFPIVAFGQTKTNLEIFRELLSESVNEAKPFFPNSESLEFSLKSFDGETILKQTLSENLSDKTLTFADSNQSIKIEATRFSVTYKPVKSYFTKSKDCERIFNVELLFSLEKNGFKTKLVKKSFNDFVTSNELEKIEDDLFGFTKAKRHSSTPVLRKYLDPILVGGATASAVILLFLIRK